MTKGKPIHATTRLAGVFRLCHGARQQSVHTAAQPAGIGTCLSALANASSVRTAHAKRTQFE